MSTRTSARRPRAKRATRTRRAKPAKTRKPAKTTKRAQRARRAKRSKPATRTKRATRSKSAKRPKRTRQPKTAKGTTRPKRTERPKPTLRVVTRRPVRRAARPAAPRTSVHHPPPAFGTALAVASDKQRLLFEMIRARVGVHAALQGLVPASAQEPTAPGKWSVREHVLHLCSWDREVTRAVESARHGVAPSWADYDRDETDRFNAAGLASLRHLGWEDAQRLLATARDRLMEELDAIPDEPSEVWNREHPMGAMLYDLVVNDGHHAAAIKRWRTQRGV